MTLNQYETFFNNLQIDMKLKKKLNFYMFECLAKNFYKIHLKYLKFLNQTLRLNL